MRRLHLVRFAPIFGLCVLVLLVASAASADTIYLKNGRIIHSSHVTVEGERVVFLQYGGKVSIPMALVDRIEEDETSGPEATPTPAPSAQPEEPEETAATAEEAGEEPPPEQTREYWQDRMRTIVVEREQNQTRLEELRRQERAFLFSQRSTAETRAEIEAVQQRMTELDEEEAQVREEARRLGIPPGWLRIEGVEGEGIGSPLPGRSG